MRIIYRVICLFMLLPLLAGCNDSDDVAAIFTGKTWKLNFIAKDGEHRMHEPYWGKSKEETVKRLNMKGTYTVRFEGMAEGDIIQGKVNGTTITSSIEGNWNANGKNNDFKANVKGNNDNDDLAKYFLEGLNTATSYEGDERNLYLIYKNEYGTFRMFFRVEN